MVVIYPPVDSPASTTLRLGGFGKRTLKQAEGDILGKPFPANTANENTNNYVNQYDLKIADADNAFYFEIFLY